MASRFFPNLFQPGRIGNVKIRNRVVMSPMGTHFQGPFGELTDKTITHYLERAKGGVGLIIVGSVDILSPGDPSYRNVPLLCLGQDRFVKSHYEMTEAIHREGAKICAQLQHVGRQVPQAWVGPNGLVSSSTTPCVFLGETAFPTPRPLNKGEIYEIIDKFAFAADRARRAGYDMVELHGAHGYLINSFISPYINKRTDEFGGSLENRLRFPIGIIKRIKEVAGSDYPVSIRISADEFVPGGVTVKESPEIARRLEEAGASVINVSSGIYETLYLSNDIMSHKEGWKTYIWEAVKKGVKVPTIAGGGHRTPEFCDKLIGAGNADFVGLGRQLLADPEWANKAAEGRVEDIRRCWACLECLYGSGGTYRRGSPRCAVNPNWGREKDFSELIPAPTKKNVMIIGGGAAGMEAARIAAQRGHNVTIYEKGKELGGQMLIACQPPGKEKILWLRDFLTTQVKKAGVKVELGTEVTADMVQEMNPDAVIVAVGSEPLVPNIPGIKGKNVVTGRDLLAGRATVKGKQIVVVGGGMIGCEVAEYLAEKSKHVTVVEMLPQMAWDMEPFNRHELLRRLNEKKVSLLTDKEVVELGEKEVVVRNKKTRRKEHLEAGAVVIALGAKPLRGIADALEGKVEDLYVIGDCEQARRFIDAVYEGSLAGRRV